MAARLSAFVVWAALAASAVFWGLRLAGASPVAPGHTVPVGDVVVPQADLTRLFGAEPVAAPAGGGAEAPPPEQSSRFRLIGLAAPRTAGGLGVAVIAVDGKPARAYCIGAAVEGDLILQSVERRSVALGPRGAPATVRLELPPMPAAATGSLPPAAMDAPPPVAVPATEGAPVPVPPPGMQPPTSGMRPSPQPPTAVGMPQQPVMLQPASGPMAQ